KRELILPLEVRAVYRASSCRLRPRVRIRVGFLQPLSGHMRINLRGRKTGVAEQCLHAAQIGAAIEHVCRETMSKFVRADRNGNHRERPARLNATRCYKKVP